MPASTLALGSASYTLLETIDSASNDPPKEVAKYFNRGTTGTLQATNRSGLISGVGILGDGETTLNVTDSSQYLVYNDTDSLDTNRSPGADANINILANTKFSTFGLGEGDNRINAARDLVNSEIQALSGNDSVRIGGDAEGSFVSLGDGRDNFITSKSTGNLDVAMGSGEDTALFLGRLTAGPGSVPGVGLQIASGSNIVDMGDGADRATFRGGIQGGTDGVSRYEIQLGADDDTVVFGGNSTSDRFVLKTGTGSDQVILGRNTTNAAIDLGWDGSGDPEDLTDDISPQGDLVVLGVGATLSDSAIRSGQSNDILRFAGTVTDTQLDLGWGNSLIEVDGAVNFNKSDPTVWDLGSGNDILTFGELSDISGSGTGYISLGSGADELNLLGSGDAFFGEIEFDLGNDGDSDTITFGVDRDDPNNFKYSGFTISNFGINDVLFIGEGSYGYGYQFLNKFANEWDLEAFQNAGNVIWSSVPTGDSENQSLMTLSEEFFDDSGDTWTALDDDDQPVMDQFDQPITISQPDNLANIDNWEYAGGDAPMSEDPPTLTTFPGDLKA